MKFFPDKVLIGTIFLVILGISAIVFVYYRQSERAQETAERVANTNDVLYRSAKIMASVEENVLRTRSFILSGDSTLIEPLRKIEEEIYTQLSALRQLTSRNKSQQLRLDSLQVFLKKRIDFSDRIIEIKIREGEKAALDFLIASQGIAYLENIRLITAHIENEEKLRLQDRKVQNRSARFNLEVVLVIILFLILVLIFFMIQKVRSEVSAFRKSEAELRYNALLIGNISDAVVSTDSEFRIKTWNKHAEEIYGWKENEVRGKKVREVLELADEDIPRETIFKKIFEEQHWSGELINHTRNGERIYVHVATSKIYNDKGLFDGTVAVIRDITARKKGQEKLRHFNRELREQVQAKTAEITNIFERVTDAFVALDKNWQYTYVNKKAAEIFNRNAQDLIGKEIWEEFPGISGDPFFAPFLLAMKDQRYVFQEAFLPSLGRWFENHIYPSPDGISIFFRDITSQIESRKALRQSEERTQLIIGSSLDAIICSDISGRITVWNPSAEKTFGWRADEIIGKQLAETIIPHKYRERHNNGMQRYLKTREGTLLNRITEIEGLHRDGTEFPVELTIIEIRQQDDDIFFCAFIRDITDRKKAERALIESEERYRLIVETAKEGIWMIDENNKTSFVNEQMALMLGYTRDEMIGRSLYDFISEEMKGQAEANVEKRRGGQSGHHEFIFQRKDGSLIHTLLATNPLSADGKYKGALAMVIDITERKLADQTIQREKELSDSIINSLPGIFYFFDFNGKFLKWNKNFESLSGYSAEEISNMTPDEFFVGPDKEHVKRAIQKAFISGYADTEAHFMSRQGVGYITYFSGRRIDVDGKPCLIGMGIDISDLKKAQNELQVLAVQLRKLSSHLQDVREEERSMIAKEIHDELGQQLTGLKIDISWLKKIDELGPEDVNERITNIQNLLDSTINTVRRISSDLRPGMLDDLGLVDTLEWQSREFAKRFGISVHFDSDNPDVLLPSSISLALFRVFQESLTNIARHANATRVDAVLHMDEDEIQLSISDNGVGFDASEVTAKRTLGLLGMRERLLAVDGSFEVISDPGKGTTIFVTVPFSFNNI